MGLLNAVRSQFADVIEFVDESNKLVVFKYGRKSGDNELKQGTKVIVRESQCAVFLKGGKLAKAQVRPPKERLSARDAAFRGTASEPNTAIRKDGQPNRRKVFLRNTDFFPSAFPNNAHFCRSRFR